MLASGPMNIEFMSDPIAFDQEPVTGAPYSAEAVTEVVQRLSDGNRIVRESKAQLNRDSQGRTRREQSLAMFGPLVSGRRGEEMRHVHITDPAIAHDDHAGHAEPDRPQDPGAQLKMMRQDRGVAPVRRQRGEDEVEKFEMAVPAPPPRRPTAGVHVSARIR